MMVLIGFYRPPKTAPGTLISSRPLRIGGGRAVGPQEKDPFEEEAGQGIPRPPHRGRPAPRGARRCTPPTGGAASAGPVRRDGTNRRGRGGSRGVARRTRGARLGGLGKPQRKLP
ncbi:MAG: hypothetical protein HWN65_22840 [Candidatus Helarchaeota archaeon]|nr:hypothetical protein [Candidatus Helarchaeota archaeon]